MHTVRRNSAPRQLAIVSALVIVALVHPFTARAELPWLNAAEDYDDATEVHSKLWEQVINPNVTGYQRLLSEAATLRRGGPSQNQAALELLGKAIKVDPRAPEAYWQRAKLHEDLGNFKTCAEDLETLTGIAPSYTPSSKSWTVDFELGTCLAQAGLFARASQQFKRILASGANDIEVQQSLGETYMAVGQLERAIEFFSTVQRMQGRYESRVHFALATAYDRQRKNAKARDEITEGLRLDPALARLQQMRNFIPSYDREYYLGLARRYDSPSWSLYYFRNYLDEAPAAGPWRARATEHVTAISASLSKAIPFTVRGQLKVDSDKVARQLLGQYPRLAACLNGKPAILLQVQLSLFAPGPTRFDQGPNMGVSVQLAQEASHAGADQVEAAIACVEEALFKLQLVAPKGTPGTSATIEFLVVSQP